MKISLDGKWNLVRSVASGKEGASPEGSFLKIQGDLFERHTPNHVFTRKLKLDTTKNPMEIDLLITNEPDLGKTFLGILECDDDILTIAHSLPGFPRPTSFESTPENQQILSISKKEPPKQ